MGHTYGTWLPGDPRVFRSVIIADDTRCPVADCANGITINPAAVLQNIARMTEFSLTSCFLQTS